MQAERRSLLAVFVAWLLGCLTPQAKAADESITWNRVFRADANGLWKEIAWEDMRSGDRVIVLGVPGKDDKYGLKIEALEIAGEPTILADGTNPVKVSALFDMTPHSWGMPDGLRLELGRWEFFGNQN